MKTPFVLGIDWFFSELLSFLRALLNVLNQITIRELVSQKGNPVFVSKATVTAVDAL